MIEQLNNIIKQMNDKERADFLYNLMDSFEVSEDVALNTSINCRFSEQDNCFYSSVLGVLSGCFGEQILVVNLDDDGALKNFSLVDYDSLIIEEGEDFNDQD